LLSPPPHHRSRRRSYEDQAGGLIAAFIVSDATNNQAAAPASTYTEAIKNNAALSIDEKTQLRANMAELMKLMLHTDLLKAHKPTRLTEELIALVVADETGGGSSEEKADAGRYERKAKTPPAAMRKMRVDNTPTLLYHTVVEIGDLARRNGDADRLLRSYLDALVRYAVIEQVIADPVGISSSKKMESTDEALYTQCALVASVDVSARVGKIASQHTRRSILGRFGNFILRNIKVMSYMGAGFILLIINRYVGASDWIYAMWTSSEQGGILYAIFGALVDLLTILRVAGSAALTIGGYVGNLAMAVRTGGAAAAAAAATVAVDGGGGDVVAANMSTIAEAGGAVVGLPNTLATAQTIAQTAGQTAQATMAQAPAVADASILGTAIKLGGGIVLATALVGLGAYVYKNWGSGGVSGGALSSPPPPPRKETTNSNKSPTAAAAVDYRLNSPSPLIRTAPRRTLVQTPNSPTAPAPTTTAAARTRISKLSTAVVAFTPAANNTTSTPKRTRTTPSPSPSPSLTMRTDRRRKPIERTSPSQLISRSARESRAKTTQQRRRVATRSPPTRTTYRPPPPRRRAETTTKRKRDAVA
jgi:hypothetical protein